MKMSEIDADRQQVERFTPEAVRDDVSRLRDFLNRLRILRSIDGHELLTAGVVSPNDALGHGDRLTRFMADPYLFFMRCDDETAMALWLLLNSRSTPSRLTDVVPPPPFSRTSTGGAR
jgi:hypothetical protein